MFPYRLPRRWKRFFLEKLSSSAIYLCGKYLYSVSPLTYLIDALIWVSTYSVRVPVDLSVFALCNLDALLLLVMSHWKNKCHRHMCDVPQAYYMGQVHQLWSDLHRPGLHPMWSQHSGQSGGWHSTDPAGRNTTHSSHQSSTSSDTETALITF